MKRRFLLLVLFLLPSLVLAGGIGQVGQSGNTPVSGSSYFADFFSFQALASFTAAICPASGVATWTTGPALPTTTDSYYFGKFIVMGDGTAWLIPTIGSVGAKPAIYRTADNTITATGYTSVTGEWLNGTAINERYILLTPYKGSYIKWWDCFTQNETGKQCYSGTTDLLYYTPVVLPSGKYLFLPYNGTNLITYDPVTDTLATGSQAFAANIPWIDTVPLPSGKVMLTPYDQDYIGIYDPATGLVASGPAIAGIPDAAFKSSFMMPDGRVFLCPSANDTIGLYNPADNTYATGPTFATNDTFNGACLLPNGKVLLAPGSSDYFYIYDPATSLAAQDIAAPSTANTFTSAPSLMGDGRVILAPITANNVYFYIPALATPAYGLKELATSFFFGGPIGNGS
jgi:hypothetical protein